LKQGYDSHGIQAKRRELFRQANAVFNKDMNDYQEMGDRAMLDTTRRRIQKLNEAYEIYNR